MHQLLYAPTTNYVRFLRHICVMIIDLETNKLQFNSYLSCAYLYNCVAHLNGTNFGKARASFSGRKNNTAFC